MRSLVFLLAVFAITVASPRHTYGEAVDPNSLPLLTVLPTVDTSGLNVSQPLQQALGQLVFQTGRYRVQFSSYSMSGFTKNDLKQTFQRLDSDLVTFSYLENGRISLFLFDSEHANEFIVITLPFQPLQEQGAQAYQTVQYYLQQAIEQAMYLHSQNQFQALPGSEVAEDDSQISDDGELEAAARSAVTKQLFLEFAAGQKANFFIGANIGMARFSAGGSSASTVNFGAYGGYRIKDNITASLGLDAFSYLVTTLSVKYRLPILQENYVSAHASMNVGMVLSALTENLGFDNTSISTGSLVFGPGAAITIPLLGAEIRADLKVLLGPGLVMIGTYGLSYAL